MGVNAKRFMQRVLFDKKCKSIIFFERTTLLPPNIFVRVLLICQPSIWGTNMRVETSFIHLYFAIKIRLD